MMGTIVEAQLYTFSSRNLKNCQKSPIEGKTVKIAQSKQFASAKTKVFLDSTVQKLFRTSVDKS